MTGVARDLPPDLARRMDELIARGDVDGYLGLLRETDQAPALPSACGQSPDCPDAGYWRAEALTARSEASPAEWVAAVARTLGVDPDKVVAALPASADEAGVWRDAAVLTRGALTPIAAAVLPRPLATGLLAYDEAPDPPRGAELLMSLAVAGPWIACTTGWALVVAAGQGAAAVARWVRP